MKQGFSVVRMGRRQVAAGMTYAQNQQLNSIANKHQALLMTLLRSLMVLLCSTFLLRPKALTVRLQVGCREVASGQSQSAPGSDVLPKAPCKLAAYADVVACTCTEQTLLACRSSIVVKA